MINTRYNRIEIEIPLCGIKIIDPEIEKIVSKEDYEKFQIR